MVTVGSESMESLDAGGVPLGAYALKRWLRMSPNPLSFVEEEDNLGN